jgi:hypothetical protein
MANTVIGASVEVEFESIGQVRKAIKDATSDLLRMQEAFGKTSPQAIAAAQRVADLKDRIQDAREQADLFDPGNKFKAFSNAASQVAAGFSAVQGAMALVGEESDDLQKTLVKVQGAMALSQGLSQIGDLGKAFDELKIVGVRAFTALKTAIGSTGIGLLVIALGAIVAYWDDIKEAVSGVSEEQKKLNKQTEDNVTAQNKKLEALDSSDNILKRQGKSEKEILKLKVDQLKLIISAQEEQIKQAKITKDSQVAAAKRNADITKQIIRGGLEVATAGLRLLAMPIDLVLGAANKVSEALGFGEIVSFNINEQITRMNEGLSNWGANKIFDPQGVESEGKKTIEAMDKTLLESKNKLDGYQNQIDEINKKGNEKRTADNKKTNDDVNKANEAAAAAELKIKEDLEKSKLDARNKELFDLNKNYEEQKKILEKGGKDTKALTELFNIEKAEINKKYDDEEKKRIDELEEKKKQAILDEQERNRKIREETLKQTKELNDAIINAEIELQNKKFDAASAGLSLLESLAGRNEKLADLIFAVQKGLDIARIVSDTARGIVSAKASLLGIPPLLPPGIPNPKFFVAAAIATKQIAGLKIAAATSIAQIAAASIQRFKRGGASTPSGGAPPPSVTGGGAAPVSPQLSPAVQGQALNAQAINSLGNNAMRAYVLNSDIQNNDQRNAYLQRNARIG